MENIITKISIDLHSPATYEVIKAQQNDTNSRVIEVVLTNNGNPYLLNEVSTIKFGGHRSDGSSFIQDCTYTDDLIIIALNENILALHGLHEGKISLYDSSNNQILSTPTIKISVQKDPCFDKENITEIDRDKIDETILEIGSYEEKLNTHIADKDIHPTKEELEESVKKEVSQNINDLETKIENIENDIDTLREDSTPDNVVLYADDGEIVEIPTVDDSGTPVNITIDSELSETSTNPVQNKVITTKLNEVFQSVSNGKDLIASAITDKGVETDADATFETMANNISLISGAGSLNGVMSILAGNTDKIRLYSKIELAKTIDLSMISSSVSFTSVIRIDDHTLDLYGDFSTEDSLIIETHVGLFFDTSILSTNMFDVLFGDLEFLIKGEILATINGRAYTKLNDGLAIGGFHQFNYDTDLLIVNKGYTGILLISEIPEACYFGGGVNITTTTEFIYDKDGKTYYVSKGGAWVSPATNVNSNGRMINLEKITSIQKACDSGRDFVLAILDYYYGYI